MAEGEEQGQFVGKPQGFFSNESHPKWQREIRPSDWINNGVQVVQSTPSFSGEEPFVMAVDKLESVLTVPMRTKLDKLMVECKADMDKKISELPASWSENEIGWKNYITAKFLFKCIVRSIYETLPDNRTGKVG